MKKELMNLVKKEAISHLIPSARIHAHVDLSVKNATGLVAVASGTAAVGSATLPDSPKWRWTIGFGFISCLAGLAYNKLHKDDQREREREREHELELAELKNKTVKTIVEEPVLELPEPQTSYSPTWVEDWIMHHDAPEYPYVLSEVVNGSPVAYQDAMHLHTTCMLGALCFSKCRAMYLDGIMHAPNLQVLIEGPWSSGKSKFEQVYNTLFERIIREDMNKITKSGKSIIQTAGVGLTGSKMIDVLANNQGCHIYIFNSEVQALVNDLKKDNGLTYEYFRKAFDNSPVYRNTNAKAKDVVNGMFPVFLNYSITGTPEDMAKFISKELEGGTASRICWTVIPESGKNLESLHLPSGDSLKQIHDRIEEWRKHYCFDVINGVDVAVQEHIVDLGYVCDALKSWLEYQWEKGNQEDNQARKDIRARAAAIAFHAAIVYAMLFDEPRAEDSEGRQKVVALTLYTANYVVERFIHKFGALQNLQSKLNRTREEVHPKTGASELVHGIPRKQAEEMYLLYKKYKTDGTNGGYGKVGKRYRLDRQKVKAIILEMKKEEGVI